MKINIKKGILAGILGTVVGVVYSTSTTCRTCTA